MCARRFRFGVVAAQVGSGDEWAAFARKVEALGYDSLLMPDGLKYTASPFPALVHAAAVTEKLHVGTYVINNDYRHPVALAKEAATAAVLTGGRLEFGIGAGRPSAEADNAMLGLSFDRGAVRLQRLTESLDIVKPLLLGETVDHMGQFYRASQASIAPVPGTPPPLMIAGSQRRLLALAAQEADIIALGIDPTATEDDVADRIGWIRSAAGDRFDRIELNLNLMAVNGHLPGIFR